MVRQDVDKNHREEYVTWWDNSTYAQNYIRFTEPVRFVPEEWIDRLRIGSNSTVVDIGCGQAKLLAAIGPFIKRGVGIEASVTMVKAASKNLKANAVNNIQIVHTDFRHMKLEPSVADAVVSMYAIHHVVDEDKQMVFEKIYKMLRPGGLFCLQDDSFNFPPDELKDRVPEIYAEAEAKLGKDGWETMKRELAGDNFENTAYLADIESMLTNAGFTIMGIDAEGLCGSRIIAQRP